MKIKIAIILIFNFVLINCTNNAKKLNSEVKTVGAIKNVMKKGELFGTIHLDTISNKENLYGLGPVEYLKGEILIIDGVCYKSTVKLDSTINMHETFDIKAPFFGYANVANWKEKDLPDSVQTLHQLEKYLDKLTKSSKRPFMFKLKGTVEKGMFHIVNLTEGTEVKSHEDAHRGTVNYEINNEEGEIIGFFSTEHQSILTHHDTYIHTHFISADRQKMGHLDEVLLKKGTMKVSLPEE